MPILHMQSDEAAKLADAIEMLYVDPSIPDDPFAGRPASDGDAAEGERLYTALGCRACHIIGANGGYLGPPLSDTRTRLKPGWVFRHLQNPQRWRGESHRRDRRSTCSSGAPDRRGPAVAQESA